MADNYNSPQGLITPADDLAPVDLTTAETEFALIPKAVFTVGAGDVVFSMKGAPDTFHTVTVGDNAILPFRVAKVKGTAGGTSVTKVFGLL